MCVTRITFYLQHAGTLVYFITAMVFCLCICISSSPHGVLIINSGSGCSTPCIYKSNS